jgi:hypothetical protein
MFDKFHIDYLANGEWHALSTQGAVQWADNPLYNSLSFTPRWVEGFRFINREATDQQRHIYKIGVREREKVAYHIRVVRQEKALRLFVDGRELDTLTLRLPASRIGLCSEQCLPVYNDVLYYQRVHSLNK